MTTRTIGRKAPDPGREYRDRCGRRLRWHRQQLGLSLEQAADAIEAITDKVITGAAVGMWERGENLPRIQHRFAVEELLGRPADELFGYAETDEDRFIRPALEAHADGLDCERSMTCVFCQKRRAEAAA